MTRTDDFTAVLEDYLETFDGETPMPARVRNAVHAELPRTRQDHRRLGPLKGAILMSSNTSTAARGGLVAAAFVVAVGLGAALLFLRPGGGPGAAAPTATPAPTSASSPAASAVRASVQTAPQVPCDDEIYETCIEPGTYTLGRAVPSAVIDVPAGWWYYETGAGGVGLLVEAADAREGSGWGIVISRVGDVARDPCDSSAGTYPAAEVDTPEEFASAMAAWPGYSMTPAEAVTIDGVPGVQTRLTTTAEGLGCDDPMSWTTPEGTEHDTYPVIGDAEPDVAVFTILDLDGPTRADGPARDAPLMIVRAMGSANTSPFERGQGIPADPTRHEADLVEQQQILDSMRFEDAAP